MDEELFFDLSLLSYFNCYRVGSSVHEFINDILNDEKLYHDYESLDYFLMNLELVKTMNQEKYKDIYIRDYVDDNVESGVVYYVFETKEQLIFAFRGSEPLDDIDHTTAWQDWSDNFRMFLPEPTYQQIYTLHLVQSMNIDKPFSMTGHSKGGNLALYCALTMRQDLLDQLQQVVAFNAPGITKEIFDLYKERRETLEFQNKLLIFENENDCVSSFFEHIKEPIYIQSSLSCNNLEQLYHNHNLYGMKDFRNHAYVTVEKKTAVPMAVYYFVNNFFVNLKSTHLQNLVKRMDDYFDSGLSMFELYRVFIYHISKYTNLFEDIDYEEIKTITFQDLMERRKSKIILDKVKQIQPKDAIKKAVDRVVNNHGNDLNIHEITQAFINNYELLVNKTSQNIQELIVQNNEMIRHAIEEIRQRKKGENESELTDSLK